MIYDLAVVGAGFWGIATHSLAKELGISCLLIDGEHKKAGSQAAAGMVRISWFGGDFFSKIKPSWWNKDDLAFGLNWLQGKGLIKTGEDVEPQYGKDKGVPTFRKDCWLIPSVREFLNYPKKTAARIQTLIPSNFGWILTSQERNFECKNVVLAGGAFTDKLLVRSGLPPVGVNGLMGRAMIFSSKIKLVRPLRILKTPYFHYTFRPWEEGEIRLGETLELSGKPEPKYNKELNELSLARFPDRELVEYKLGLRPDTGKFFVEKVKPGLVVATGAHRIGLGLSGGAARKALKLLGLY